MSNHISLWLGKKLTELGTDDSVFGPYIISILEGEDETAEEKEEGIEGILSDVLDDEAVIKATLAQILDQWSKAKTAEANDEVVKKIDLDKMDLVEKMSQITQEKLATYTPKKQEEQTEEQRRIKEAILQGYSEAPDGSETESDDEDGGGGAGGGGLMANNNAASIQAEQAEYREKQKAAAIAKKEKDKQDRTNQKNQAEERKKKAQAKAAKGERRA